MVSGVSSILRKIKDKKNRKEVAGDMVNQFNREGVNYNKEKFLKNSRSFATGGPVKPIYTSNPKDPRIGRYADSLNLYNKYTLPAYNLVRKYPDLKLSRVQSASGDPDGISTIGPYHVDRARNSRYHDFYGEGIILPGTLNSVTRSRINPIGYQRVVEGQNHDNYFPVYKKPVQPVIYKPAPKKNTMTTMSKASNKKATTTSTTSTTPKTTTSTITPTVTTSTTTPVQTPRQLPANTPQMQTYNNMSTEDKKRAVKKYGDPCKVPFQGVDVNQLRKEVPTFKKGGQHGGLDRWFAEKWVDVKTGKPCGRQEGENRAYPACRPSKRVSSKTPKTSSELSSKEKARFKATKTSSQRIPYNHKRK